MKGKFQINGIFGTLVYINTHIYLELLVDKLIKLPINYFNFNTTI